MARPVKSKEVSQLIIRHEKMNSGLKSIDYACDNLFNKISNTAERYRQGLMYVGWVRNPTSL